MPKKYNTPHRSVVVKTHLTEEEHTEFLKRLNLYDMSQAEFIRQAIEGATIKPIIRYTPVNDDVLATLGTAASATLQRKHTLQKATAFMALIVIRPIVNVLQKKGHGMRLKCGSLTESIKSNSYALKRFAIYLPPHGVSTTPQL